MARNNPSFQEAVERLVTLLAAECTDQQAFSAWGASIAEACRLLEQGRPRDAILMLGANLPGCHAYGTKPRIDLCKLHPPLAD